MNQEEDPFQPWTEVEKSGERKRIGSGSGPGGRFTNPEREDYTKRLVAYKNVSFSIVTFGFATPPPWKSFFWGFKKRSYFIFLNNFSEIFKSSSLAFLSIIIIFLSLILFQFLPNLFSTCVWNMWVLAFMLSIKNAKYALSNMLINLPVFISRERNYNITVWGLYMRLCLLSQVTFKETLACLGF